MKIEKNKVVAVNYALRTEENGPIVEQTKDDRLLEFLFGRGMMLQKFEDNLNGKSEGDKVSFHLTPEEGYGEYNKDIIVDIPRRVFEVDGVLNEKICFVGNHIPMQDNKGNHMIGKILEISADSVKMDFNHDMAGKDLYFEVEVKSIREATEEEIEHGHVHHDGHCCHGEGKCHKHEDGEHHCCHGEDHDHEDGEHHCCHGEDHDHEDGEHHCCHDKDHDHEDGEHHCCHKNDK